MSEIALNFFPLANDQFTITVHCVPYVENCRPSIGDEEAVRRYIEISGVGDYRWTLFQRPENGTKVVCDSFDNIYLTIAALRSALIGSCIKELNPDQFTIVGGFRKRVEILLAEFPQGQQVVSLEPYYLRSNRRFGFIVDFRFHPTPEYRGTKIAQTLSLSLDKNGKTNLNHYADRYSRITQYSEKFHHQIFPLTVPGGQEVDAEPKLLTLDHKMLDVKNYIVSDGSESNSQFMGIKQSGPFKHPENIHLYFIYRTEDRHLSHDLYRALRGDTFGTFPGMERMFDIPMSKENVNGTTVSNFGCDEIERVRDRVVRDAAGRNIVSIVLTPFSKHDVQEVNAPYWHLKHAFLSKGMPIQVVSTRKVADKNELKWATASIGL